MQRIKLPEHNSSRLLFVDNNNISDPSDFELHIKETTSNQSENDNYDSPNFILGKLTNNILYIEDTGVYDSNYENTCEIYTENNGVKNTLYNVTRIMEYGGECDRLYMSHSGGLKVIFLDSPSVDLTANFFIKYERSLPPAKEYYGALTNNVNGETIHNCIAFLKYDNSISEVIQLIVGLEVNKEELDENGNTIPMENINYCNIKPKQIEKDFSKITLTYTIDPNTSNEPKIGMIGTRSIGGNSGQLNYCGKFVSYKYFQNNDSYIEPGYFVVQAPKNRSWICYRSAHDYVGTPIGISTSNNELKRKNNCICTYIKCAMNGYYGTFENGKYYYTIEIDRTNLPFTLYLPLMFCDYISIHFLDQNDNDVRFGYTGDPIQDIYNEYDGMFYRLIIIGPNTYEHKIKLEYNAL